MFFFEQLCNDIGSTNIDRSVWSANHHDLDPDDHDGNDVASRLDDDRRSWEYRRYDAARVRVHE